MATLRVQVVCGWPRRFQAVELALPQGATVADAVVAAGIAVADIGGYAVYGERASATTVLRDGDRVELLRPLQADPKEARRRRAAEARGRR